MNVGTVKPSSTALTMPQRSITGIIRLLPANSEANSAKPPAHTPATAPIISAGINTHIKVVVLPRYFIELMQTETASPAEMDGLESIT